MCLLFKGSRFTPRLAYLALWLSLLDLCVSSLRTGHANILCIVPSLTDDPRRESYLALWLRFPDLLQVDVYVGLCFMVRYINWCVWMYVYVYIYIYI